MERRNTSDESAAALRDFNRAWNNTGNRAAHTNFMELFRLLHIAAGSPSAEEIVAAIGEEAVGSAVRSRVIETARLARGGGSPEQTQLSINRVVGEARRAGHEPVKSKTVEGWIGGARPRKMSEQVIRIVEYLWRQAGLQQFDADVEARWRAVHTATPPRSPANAPPTTSASAQPPGTPVSGISNRDAILLLGVHRAMSTGVEGVDQSLLPSYLERGFDLELRRRATEIAGTGRSGVIVLVGNSATGKSRAAWEAVKACLPDWRIWFDLEAGYCAAEVRAAVVEQRLAEKTVVWLDDLQHYLEPNDEGPLLAGALAAALEMKGPRLVLATIWPESYARLTNRATGAGHAIRKLLQYNEIRVPDIFSEAELALPANVKLLEQDDHLSRAASRSRGDGFFVQTLAGVPEIERRYELIDATEQAVLWATTDAHRLSKRWRRVSGDFLKDVARAYLPPVTARLSASTWDHKFRLAMEGLTQGAHGLDGLLLSHLPQGVNGADSYELNDVIEQRLRRERAANYLPPEQFWTSIQKMLDLSPEVRADLAEAAHARGLSEQAARIIESDVIWSDPETAGRVGRLHAELGDSEAAAKAGQLVAAGGHLTEAYEVACALSETGEWRTAERIAGQLRLTKAGTFEARNLYGKLVRAAAEEGAWDDAERLAEIEIRCFAEYLAELPAHEQSSTAIYSLGSEDLARRLREAGDYERGVQWALTAAGNQAPSDAFTLVTRMAETGNWAAAEEFASHLADNYGYPDGFYGLAEERFEEGNFDEAMRLAVKADYLGISLRVCIHAARGDWGAAVQIIEGRLELPEPMSAVGGLTDAVFYFLADGRWEELRQLACRIDARYNDYWSANPPGENHFVMPSDTLAHIAGLAATYEMPEAAEYFAGAADREGQGISACRAIAYAQMRMRNWEEAERFAEIVNERGDERIWGALSVEAVEIGDMQRAELYAERGAERGDRGWAFGIAAITLTKQDNWSEAIRYAVRSAEEGDENRLEQVLAMRNRPRC